MIIKSFVGGHPVKIYSGCEYDPTIRKYRGGKLIAEIPYSGRMLSAQIAQEDAGTIKYDCASIPLRTAQTFVSADPIPSKNECDYCIVSAIYVAACRSLGLDTSRLLTMGDLVADDDGRVIGTLNFNKN